MIIWDNSRVMHRVEKYQAATGGCSAAGRSPGTNPSAERKRTIMPAYVIVYREIQDALPLRRDAAKWRVKIVDGPPA
jgi:hypothetical protein